MSGFEAFNDSGSLQASSELSTYSLVNSGILTLDVDHWGSALGHMDGAPTDPLFLYTGSSGFGVPGSVQGDLVAVRSTTNPVAVYPIYPGSGIMPSWKFISATSGTQVSYYAFQKTSRIVVPEHGTGLEVFTGETGLHYPPPDFNPTPYPIVSFSSNHKPLRFVSSHSVGLPGTSETFVAAPRTGVFAALIRSSSITQVTNIGGVTPDIDEPNIVMGFKGFMNPIPNGRVMSIRMASNGFYYRGLDGLVYTNGNKSDGLVQLVDVENY